MAKRKNNQELTVEEQLQQDIVARDILSDCERYMETIIEIVERRVPTFKRPTISIKDASDVLVASTDLNNRWRSLFNYVHSNPNNRSENIDLRKTPEQWIKEKYIEPDKLNYIEKTLMHEPVIYRRYLETITEIDRPAQEMITSIFYYYESVQYLITGIIRKIRNHIQELDPNNNECECDCTCQASN